jgi:hypothetical protein
VFDGLRGRTRWSRCQPTEATWREVASFSDSRGRAETERLQREQPDLTAYVLGATEDLPPAVHALGFYLFLVIWRSFDRAGGKIRRVKAGAIERRLEQKVDALSRLEHADERFLERAAVVQSAKEPAVFKYMVEAIMEAPDDPEDPVSMTSDESGTLFLVMQVAIDLLHDAREGASSRRTRG